MGATLSTFLPSSHTASQTDRLPLTDTPELILRFILAFLVSLELPLRVTLDAAPDSSIERTCVFKRSLLKKLKNTMGEMWKSNNRRGGRLKRGEGRKREERTFLLWRESLKQITVVCNQGAEIAKLLGHHSNR